MHKQELEMWTFKIYEVVCCISWWTSIMTCAEKPNKKLQHAHKLCTQNCKITYTAIISGEGLECAKFFCDWNCLLRIYKVCIWFFVTSIVYFILSKNASQNLNVLSWATMTLKYSTFKLIAIIESLYNRAHKHKLRLTQTFFHSYYWQTLQICLFNYSC